METAKTRFRTAEELIEYLSEVRPMVEMMLQVSGQDHSTKGRHMFQQAEKLMKALDPEFLRGCFKPNRPDGSMEIGFTADAWALLQKARRGDYP